MQYAAELDNDGVVVRVIVGTAQWAADNLGGTWQDSHDLVGIGWKLVDGHIVEPDPQGTDVDVP